MKKDFISIIDFSSDEIYETLSTAMELKKGSMKEKILRDKSLAMIFEYPSTRTRVSFEVAMNKLGGHALYLSWKDLQLGRGETIADTAKVLSRYVDTILVRTDEHRKVCEMAENATVPVINALSSLEHPCQALADLLTIRAHKHRLEGLKLAWIGDGNNVCNSIILASSLVDMDVHVACPKGYEPAENPVEITNDPKKCATGADVLYTDVWVSMSEEERAKERLRDFEGFQVNQSLVEEAKDDVIVLHCLPAHRGQEITDEVIDGVHSVVWEQAENRLYAQEALLIKLLAR